MQITIKTKTKNYTIRAKMVMKKTYYGGGFHPGVEVGACGRELTARIGKDSAALLRETLECSINESAQKRGKEQDWECDDGSVINFTWVLSSKDWFHDFFRA